MTPPVRNTNITLPEVKRCVETYSQISPNKVKELEPCRFVGIPEAIANRAKVGLAYLEKCELEKLMRYKLTRGTFRPTLMSLIASNSEKTVRAVTEKAFSAYTGNDGSVEKVKEAILALTEVKGVGPATASLILSVYDPVSVPFFADELFLYTTARGMFASQAPGQKYKIKYNLKEYEEMLLQVQMIRERITTQANGVAGVSALDLEMTAYVLAHPPQLGQDRDGDKPTEEGQDKATATTAAVSNDKHDVTNNTTTHYGEEPPAKRRRTSERPT